MHTAWLKLACQNPWCIDWRRWTVQAVNLQWQDLWPLAIMAKCRSCALPCIESNDSNNNGRAQNTKKTKRDICDTYVSRRKKAKMLIVTPRLFKRREYFWILRRGVTDFLLMLRGVIDFSRDRKRLKFKSNGILMRHKFTKIRRFAPQNHQNCSNFLKFWRLAGIFTILFSFKSTVF